MTLEEKKPYILEAVALMKERGVTAIKMELEAQMGRGSDEDDYCDYCDEGYRMCDSCDGDGTLRCHDCRYDEDDDRTDCDNARCSDGFVRCPDECEEGSVICTHCDGNYAGNSSEYGSDDACMRYLLTELGVPHEVANQHDGDWEHDDTYLPWLQFARFYNDHSVDSELTFTVRLDNPENIFKLLDVTNAFISLSKEISPNGMDVAGAGMHTSLIFHEDYLYDNSVRNNTIPAVKIGNFARAMKQLLPALYFLSTHNDRTRSLHFREPRVSFGDQKYSAIHYTHGALEFRIFDTCYDNPEDLFDNIVVIANCSRYLTDVYTGPRLHRRIQQFHFGRDDNDQLVRLFSTEQHLDMLATGLKHLKPAYYTIKELKKQRKFVINRGTLRKLDKEAMENAKRAYEEYSDRFNLTMLYKEDELRALHLRRFLEQHDIEQLRAMSEKQIREAVELKVLEGMDRERSARQEEQHFVQNELERFNNKIRGQYRITLA